MNKSYFFSPVVFCLGLSALPVYAAEPVLLQKTSFTQLQTTFQIVLTDNQSAASVQAQKINALKLVSQHTDSHNVTHARMQQQYAGFPVFGGYAILHSTQPVNALLSSNASVKMSGIVYDGLSTDLGEPGSLFTARAAIALQEFKEQYANQAVSQEKVIPMVYMDAQHHASWAYKVSLFISHTAAIPERPTAILDAQTLKPIVQWNNLKTAHTNVQGIGFGGNYKTGLYQFGNEFPALAITRDNKTAVCYMENADVKVVDMLHKSTGPKAAMQFSCLNSSSDSSDSYWTGPSGDGYDQKNGGFSPSNDALYAGGVIKDLYKKWYGIDVLTKLDQPMQLIMRVHYGVSYENAYWDSKQMTFGDGGGMMYPLVSIGIGAHEISHGFTEQHSNLQYFGQSGGMNEAFSDMAAQAAEYYSTGKNSWMIGSEVMKEASGWVALRFLDIPSRDGSSIDRANQYHDNLDVHYSSGVYNRLFYLLANQPGWDVKKAFQVMMKANMDYWTPYSNFEEGACGILSAADDLELSTDGIKQALAQVAIKYSDC